jgi:hypothetical protein
MSNASVISQAITEIEQSVREMQTEAAKPGKGQALAQMRLDRRQAALKAIVWCRDNSDEIREFRKAKGQGE